MQEGREFNPGIEQTNHPESDFFGRLRERLSSLWSREKKEDEPNLNIRIFFAPHASAEDSESIKEEFNNCDVYIPEAIGWNKNILTGQNLLSQGKLSPKDFLLEGVKFPEYALKQMEMIYKSNKPITFIDVPADHPVMSEQESVDGRFSDRMNTAQNFQEMVDAKRQQILEESQIQKTREEYMVTSLRPNISKLLHSHPELNSKDTLNVLISLGAIHTGVYHEMKSHPVKLDRKFKSLPYVYNPDGEAIRTAQFGKELNNDVIARALFYDICGNYFRKYRRIFQTGTKTEEQDAESFIRLFDYQELSSLWGRGQNKKEFTGNLKYLCKKKGIPVPNFID